MRPLIFLFVLPKRKIAPRPVEERKGRPRAEPVYRDQAGHRDRRTFSLVRVQSWDCGPPLPGAEEGGTESPQPRFLQAVAKQARKKQMRQGGIDWRNQYRAEPLRLALPWAQVQGSLYRQKHCTFFPPRPGGIQEGARRPPLAVSIRGFLGGKNSESSPLNGVSFAAALSKCAGGTFVA